MKKLKQYPTAEGWIYMTLTMTSKKPNSEEEIKQIASFGKPGDYEWGPVEQHGNKITAVSRHKDRKPAPSSPSEN